MKFLVALTVFGTAFALTAAPEPVFRFTFNEGTGNRVKEVSSDSIVSIKGENYSWKDGRNGKPALFFDNPVEGKRKNNSCIAFSIKDKIDFSKPFTLATWCYVEPDASSDKSYDIAGCMKGDYGPGWRLSYCWGFFRFFSGNGTGKSLIRLDVNSRKTPAAKGRWIHVAVVSQNDGAAIYIDGKLSSEKKMKITSGQDVLTLGAYVSGFAYGFRGGLSDFRLYNTALTPEEIKQIFQAE